MTEITEEYILQAATYKQLQRELRQLTVNNYINLNRMVSMYEALNESILENGELFLMFDFHFEQLNKTPGAIEAIQVLLEITNTWKQIVKGMSLADPSLFIGLPVDQEEVTEVI